MPMYVCTLDDVPRGHELLTILYKAMENIESALELLHGLEFFHCDIKPANIFMDSNGGIVLGDFGSTVGEGQEIYATPGYVPKEAMKHNSACRAFDYSLLAATLADMLQLYSPDKAGAFSLYTPLPEDLPHEFLTRLQEIWAIAQAAFPIC